MVVVIYITTVFECLGLIHILPLLRFQLSAEAVLHLPVKSPSRKEFSPWLLYTYL